MAYPQKIIFATQFEKHQVNRVGSHQNEVNYWLETWLLNNGGQTTNRVNLVKEKDGLCFTSYLQW